MQKEEVQYRKINDSYNSFSFMFYETQRKDGEYSKESLNKQIDKLIKELNTLKEM